MSLRKCTAKLAEPIELKFTKSSKGPIVMLYTKFSQESTYVVNFTDQKKQKKAKIRNTHFHYNFECVQQN